MRDLDEKWVAEISNGYGDNVELLLSKNRDYKPRTKEETEGGFKYKTDRLVCYHVHVFRVFYSEDYSEDIIEIHAQVIEAGPFARLDLSDLSADLDW
jgi:hypothetical protein